MSTVSSFDGEKRKPQGAVLFTGPDGVGDFKVLVEEQKFVGHGSMSPEASSDTEYLYRAASGCPHPPPKTARVGEVGWGVPRLTDHGLLKSGHQIMVKEFRRAAEDRHTHLYQSPYYPPPPLPAAAAAVHQERSSAAQQYTQLPPQGLRSSRSADTERELNSFSKHSLLSTRSSN